MTGLRRQLYSHEHLQIGAAFWVRFTCCLGGEELNQRELEILTVPFLILIVTGLAISCGKILIVSKSN